ncbi:hypothetical protein LZ30DRAFT_589804 [Colletotrichum cereale]|nr:hypothetical protein LZ30DRAFT_589804 [Colletotrichum cereale]
MPQPANAQQMASVPQSTNLEQTAIGFYLFFCLPGGTVHPEYLAHLGRYSKERVEFCEKTLAALDRAWQLSVRQGVLRADQQAPEIAILEDYCENNLELWKKLKGLVEA